MQNGFKNFLEAYKEKVLSILEDDLIDTPESGVWDKKTSEEKMKEVCKEKISWIKRGYCYDLDLESNHIQCSWLYEYTIFNLIHWYKTIDWNNEIVMFYAY